MKLNDTILWTALITPFTEDLKVDYDSLKRVIKEQESAGNGILLLGSTGEALNIDDNTKKEIINFACELNPKVPLMAGVGGHQLEQTKQWVQFLEKKTLDAYLFVTPLYAKPGDEGQYHWFKILMDMASKKVMLYNVPGRTGTSLSIEAVSRLKNHPNYWAIKEASGSLDDFKEYLKVSEGPVYCGDDGLFADFSLAGSCGLVSVASNVWPKQTHQYVKQCLEKSFDEKQLWVDAANSLFIASNPVPAKAIMHHQKRINHPTMMPPLSANDLNDLTAQKVADTKVNQWFNEQKG